MAYLLKSGMGQAIRPSPSNDDLRAAVRGLRLALGKTQTEFGALIEKSLPTIQRYESVVPPRGKVLLKLERLARGNCFDEHAQSFREALRADLGLDLPDIAATSHPVPKGILCHRFTKVVI
jgi:transcriptional regulator with XRE-family HTH domain